MEQDFLESVPFFVTLLFHRQSVGGLDDHHPVSRLIDGNARVMGMVDADVIGDRRCRYQYVRRLAEHIIGDVAELEIILSLRFFILLVVAGANDVVVRFQSRKFVNVQSVVTINVTVLVTHSDQFGRLFAFSE